MSSENRMSVRRSLIPLVLALFAARCTNGSHPTAVEQPAAPAPHFLRWAGGSPPQFTATGALSGLPVGGALLASQAAGLSLDRYTASFWAGRGEPASLQIHLLSSTR